MSTSRTAVMVEGALCIALFIVLSWLPLFRMPQGGSVTLDLVPLIVFAWRRGVHWGCGAGALGGILNMILGGYVVHPVQVLLDYPLAFACMGLAGLFPRQRLAGLLPAGLLKSLCHVLSGVFFFAAYAPAGTNVWIYSITYNLTFSIPQFLICGVASWLIWRRLERIYPGR